MKRKSILIFIAAVALLSSLCGVFFYGTDEGYNPVSATKTLQQSQSFSLEDAKEGLSLCALSYKEEELKALLQDKGYADFRYYERAQDTPLGSGIAFGIAHKQQDNKNSVVIVVRGTNKGEWYSNFQIGENTEHTGFSAATDFVMSKTEEYLNKKGITKSNTSLFITGHSRGGAVANICAKRLIDDNLFQSVSTYTFASPNTTTALDAKDNRYKGIYNIVNPEDFICSIPLAEWGYTKYGTDISLPEKGCENYYDLYSRMEELYFENAQRNHAGYPDGDRDVKRFLEKIASITPTIHDYYNKEITLFPTRVTMYEYMQSAAALLSGESALSNGMILLGGSTSPILSAVTDFIMQGISVEDMAEDTDFMSSAVGSAHTYETYSSWLLALNDEYFTSYLSE